MNMVAEGYYASKSIHEINRKHKVSMPICDMVYSVLYKNLQAKKEMIRLTKILS